MKRKTKLIIAFIISIICSLLLPIFTQWYEQVTGITPVVFWFIYVVGSLVSILAIATNDFKDFT